LRDVVVGEKSALREEANEVESYEQEKLQCCWFEQRSFGQPKLSPGSNIDS